jgi:hypothetical protein
MQRLRRSPHYIAYQEPGIQFQQPPLSEFTDDGASGESSSLPGAKSGFVQYLGLDYTYLAGGGSNGFGIDTISSRASFGLPLPSLKWPTVISPGYLVHYLNGPDSPDMPSQLHDAYLEFRWPWKLTEHLLADMVVAPGIYTDFDNTSSDMLRISGRGVGVWFFSPELQMALGVAYLDRRNFSVLPVAGLIYQPNASMRWELIAPRPRVAMEFWPGYWGYVAGEIGGGEWAIQDVDLTNDVVTYNDYRVIVGIESKRPGPVVGRFEVGYVFGRELEFRSAIPTFKPEDTVLVRAGLSY